jgi:membrane associated rhomboid family serine protease
MLSDRNYMSPQDGNSERASGGVRAVFILIAINVAVFLLIPGDSWLYSELSMSTFGIKSLKLWQLATAMFLHSKVTIMHLLFNMWGLYLFGTIVAPVLGARRFLTLYLISGVCGNLLWMLFNWDSPVGLVGASGALFGIMLATAMLYPDKEFIMIFLPVPMKTKTLVIVYAVIEVFSELSMQDNIAHLAHLGGFLGGYVYIKFLFGKNIPWDLFGFLIPGVKKTFNPPPGWTLHPQPRQEKGDDYEEHLRNPDQKVTQRELDQILDKISHTGINSLSETEMGILKKAREQMRKI